MIKNLKSLRTEKGISQQQLASVIGVSQQSINKYENHDVEPDIFILCALADYFDTTIDYLVGRSKTKESDADFEISNQEICLLKKIRKLNKTEKLCVNTLINTYSELKK